MDVRLPRLGEGADSGTVVKILVKEGEQVKQDQPILELENKKAVAPIPSSASGTVTRIHVKEGEKVSVGQVLLSLSEEAAPGSSAGVAQEAPEAEAARQEALGTEEAEEAVPPGGGTPAASPSVRKLARELGIDLARVRGTERGGRITLTDVRRYTQRLQAGTTSTGAPGVAPEQIDFSKWGPVTAKPLSALRATVSRRMSASWTTIPHVTQFDEADITELMALKQRYDPRYEQRGAKLTLTSFILKALASILRQHPIFNASLDEAGGQIVFKQYYHIGIAVDTEAGLMVPVIRDVDKKTMLQLSLEIQQVAEKARQRTVTMEDLRGGTFTVSNQGGIGGGHFTPIINRPEVAILGVGRGVRKPVVREQQVEPRVLLPLALSYDHRVIDGADAARFITALVADLERFPESEVTL